MTHIDKNYGPIILGDYIEKQENYIDKQLNVINGEPAASGQSPKRGTTTDADTGAGTGTDTTNMKTTDTNAGTRTGNDKRPSYCMEERVQCIFNMAEADGLLSHVDDGYVWHENATLLDYFLGRALCGDYPFRGASAYNERPVWHYDEQGKPMPVNDMNRLFGHKNIGAARRTRHMQPVPYGHERIDEIIDACS